MLRHFLLLLQCIYKAFMRCEGATLSLKGYENQINLYYEKQECCCVTPRWSQRVFPHLFLRAPVIPMMQLLIPFHQAHV